MDTKSRHERFAMLTPTTTTSALTVLLVVWLALLGNSPAAVSAAKYPQDLQRCPIGDNACVRDTATLLIKKLAKGDPRVNLATLDPLHISSMTLKQGTNSPVNIELKWTDVKLFGLSEFTFTNVSGFNTEPKGQYEFRLTGPVLHLVGPYTIGGQVLILPIQGKGHSNMTLDNPDLMVRFSGRSLMRGNREYLTTDDLKLTFNITRLHYHFENLYNGDKLLGDSTNTFLNENWQDIYKELRPLIFDGFTLIIQQMLVNFFHKVPFRELFQPE